ncbi:hypothetical protein DFH09DRAFT_1067425 [Mycena vulgaris]|nr:hypothetical protein DFH09DRAFT_1067425 [Mycena vulgaris]
MDSGLFKTTYRRLCRVRCARGFASSTVFALFEISERGARWGGGELGAEESAASEEWQFSCTQRRASRSCSESEACVVSDYIQRRRGIWAGWSNSTSLPFAPPSPSPSPHQPLASPAILARSPTVLALIACRGCLVSYGLIPRPPERSIAAIQEC